MISTTMMAKRSLTKSGSTTTVGQGLIGVSPISVNPSAGFPTTSSTTTIIPPYAPLSPLNSSNKQYSSETSSNIYAILQDQKRPNQLPTSSISAQQNLSAALQAALSSAKQNPSWGLPLSSMQKAQPSISPLSSPPSSSNLISTQQSSLPASSTQAPSLLQQHNQRLLLSTQKQTTGSLQIPTTNNNSISNNLNTSTTSYSAAQKSPASMNYRNQSQNTPTSIKNALYNIASQSPKLNLQSSQLSVSQQQQQSQHLQQQQQQLQLQILKGSLSSAVPTSYHSHRPSLATQSSATSNENTLNATRRHDSKPELSKKPYYSTNSSDQPSGQTYQSSILKENNAIKNNPPSAQPPSTITKITRPTGNSLAAKDLLEATRNFRNHSSSAAIEANTIATNSRSTHEQQSSQTAILTAGSERNYASMPRTAGLRSPNPQNLNGSKNSLSMTMLNTNPAVTQTTDYLDSLPQHMMSTDQSALNLSSLSQNLSQLNISERGAIDPISHSETTQADALTQSQCINHPYKKAKYIIFNSTTSNNLYCSKCAVELSKFGFQTIHISDYAKQQSQPYNNSEESQHMIQGEHHLLPNASNQRTNSKSVNHSQQSQQDLRTLQSPQTERNTQIETQAKMTELKQFLDSIDSHGGKWSELNHALLIKKQDVCNFYDRQEQRVEAQFAGYIEILNSMKEKTLERIQISKEKSVQAYQQWEKETKENLTDFINIKADIDMNTDKIVHQIQMEDFTRIMTSYKEKFLRMTHFFQEMANQCLDLVKFDTHSPLPIVLAPQIAESFSVINFTTTLVKKRVSEFVSAKKMTSNTQNSSQNLNGSLLYTSASSNQLGYKNITSDNSPSPNMKSTNPRMSTAAPAVSDTYASNSHGISTRGSIGNSSTYHHFGSGKQQQSQQQSHSNQTAPESVSDYSNYYYPTPTAAPTAQQGNHSNSPVKTDPSSRSDLSKKDVYVSFGNNKDAQLQKAIQQVKFQNQQAEMSNSIAHQLAESSQHQSYMESIQQTPAQHNGVYIHQIKPLTDILENSNIQDEEDDGKSQPNTPELKQIENRIQEQSSQAQQQSVQQQQQQLQQQRPFRTLFGEEEAYGNQQDQQLTPKQVPIQSAYSEISNIPSATNDWSSQLQQQNSQQPLQRYGASNNSSVIHKSPRYSMYECDESDTPLSYDYPKVSSTNNQLDDYIQMLERQNGPAEYSYSQQASSLSNNGNEYLLNKNNNSAAGYSYHDENDVTVNMKNDEDGDHPLFSSPKQQQN